MYPTSTRSQIAVSCSETPMSRSPYAPPRALRFMTGLYPHAAGPIVNKIHLPLDTPVIAEMIDDEYFKGYMGKWHLGNDVQVQHGFDVWNPD